MDASASQFVVTAPDDERGQPKARKAAPHNNPDGKPLGRDERVSFYPMEPEDLLKKLVRTPPTTGRIQGKGEEKSPPRDEG